MKTTLEHFKAFSPVTDETFALTDNCVVYTRVSSKEQDDNTSLPYQKARCEEYAKRKGYNIVEYFGGTYESAKNDERKEFQRMIKFVKSSRHRVSRIIVLSFDRFSRSGANAIYLISSLKQLNIYVESVTQEADYSTPSGELMQGIQLLFSKLDNDQRRQKTIAGMVEMYKQGYWPNKAPYGYRHNKGADWENRIVPHEKLAPLIRKAFLLKAQHGKSNTEITTLLSAMGLNLNRKRLTDIFKNPFYCGILISKFLPGQVIEGKHEPIISRELFLKVNSRAIKNKYGIKAQKEDSHFPLKQFVICDNCGTPLTAYHVKKKKATYYKCNKIGCCLNRNTNVLHQKLMDMLKATSIPEKWHAPLKEMMLRVFDKINEADRENNGILTRQLNAIEHKISELVDQFVLKSFTKDIFEKTLERYTKEKNELLDKLNQQPSTLSNLEKYITFTLKMAQSLDELWQTGNYEQKKRLQSLIYPKGLSYNKEKDHYRTLRMNSMFLLPSILSKELDQQKSGKLNFDIDFSALVALTGIEPGI